MKTKPKKIVFDGENIGNEMLPRQPISKERQKELDKILEPALLERFKKEESRLIKIREYFTERRLKCLSISRIEKEAELPAKTLDHFLCGRRNLNLKAVANLEAVLSDFGFS